MVLRSICATCRVLANMVSVKYRKGDYVTVGRASRSSKGKEQREKGSNLLLDRCNPAMRQICMRYEIDSSPIRLIPLDSVDFAGRILAPWRSRNCAIPQGTPRQQISPFYDSERWLDALQSLGGCQSSSSLKPRCPPRPDSETGARAGALPPPPPSSPGYPCRSSWRRPT